MGNDIPMISDNSIVRPLSRLSTWARNYRRGDVNAIIASIARFGMNGALRVWRDGTVIAGNHTLMALRQMKAQGADVPHGVIARDGEWWVLCMVMRGIRTPAVMTSTLFRGRFEAEADLRRDFWERVQRPSP